MKAKEWINLSLSACLVGSFMGLTVSALPQKQPAPASTSARSAALIEDSILEQRAQELIKQAEGHFLKGSALFKQKQIAAAQVEFDAALQSIDKVDDNLRQYSTVVEYYGRLLDKINDHAVAESGAEPKYEQSNRDELSRVDVPKEQPKKNITVDRKQFDFEFEITPEVAQFITYFTEGRGRTTMASGLQRSGRYRKLAEKIFREEGVPVDLIWLAQVESVWKPLALSHAAAKGIWQFIPSTGLEYGLAQTPWVDERSNPEKQTRAAARYLRFLANYFAGDWLLAMAAYNTGPGRVERGIARCGFADFWEIQRRGLLLRETQNYVPAILATIIIAKNQEQYGFNVTPDAPWTYDTYQLPEQTDLRVVADLLNTSLDTIQQYNPELRRPVTPPGTYTIRLPRGTVESFALAYAELPAEKRIRQEIIIPYRNAPQTVYTTHRVSRGETLGRLAGRMGVSQQELANLNGVSPNAELRAGQTIRIPKRSAGYRSKAVSRRSSARPARKGHATRARRR